MGLIRRAKLGLAVILVQLSPVLDQNLYYMGMKNLSATFTSAMLNMLPAFAFCLAWIFRYNSIIHTHVLGHTLIYRQYIDNALTCRFEKVSLKKLHSIAKVMGTVITAITLRSYPCQLSLTAMICFWGMVEGAILAFIVERGHSGAWSIQFNIELAMQSGVAYYVMGMVVKEKGPIFYLAFHPLATVGCNPGFLVLAEQLYIGSVIGVALIIIGLYLVLWGKAKDQSPPSQCCMIDEVALITQRLIDDQQR
ncbi:hypothetical protein RchiOBHm_Chr1g0337261 [Rosa chinensis]|uniref:WAT1-related protein n=1 Tax=Rosa chinensis TaxID=74649 RepID=A0A2P6SCX2_ROSCH|nr:hypothetical protein RchiOBHm_Chr1g0337261 [Rosa chinensis]